MTDRDTNSDWKEIARTDPYWGVLSIEGFRGVALDKEMEDKFFATGSTFVSSLLGLINKYLMDAPSPGARWISAAASDA